tara:strand:- start:184 stop:849 length:666 start_codon:yes stop_codon:yes gene_type:complete
MTYCQLLGTEYSIYVQAILLATAIISLLIRRYREHPKRRSDIWLLDISKQGLSSLMAHGIGLLVSISLSSISDEKYQCGWYLVTYIVDTSLGTYLVYKLVKYTEMKAVKKSWSSLKDTGFYGFPKVNYKVYLKQLLCWILIVIVARLICLITLLIFFVLLQFPVKGLSSLFDGHPDEYLLFVMIFGPICLNSIQVYIQDKILGNQYKNNELSYQLKNNENT